MHHTWRKKCRPDLPQRKRQKTTPTPRKISNSFLVLTSQSSGSGRRRPSEATERAGKNQRTQRLPNGAVAGAVREDQRVGVVVLNCQEKHALGVNYNIDGDGQRQSPRSHQNSQQTVQFKPVGKIGSFKSRFGGFGGTSQRARRNALGSDSADQTFEWTDPADAELVGHSVDPLML